MPQLDLVTAKSVPFGVRLELRVDPLEPQTTITEVRVFGPENDVIASTGGLWTGIMTDHLPDLARAVVEGYLWGEGSKAIVDAARRLRRDAIRAQHDWLTRLHCT